MERCLKKFYKTVWKVGERRLKCLNKIWKKLMLSSGNWISIGFLEREKRKGADY